MSQRCRTAVGRSFAVSLVAPSIAVFCGPSSLRAQATERVSVGAGPVEADAASRQAALSADGRFVVFASAATNLVAGDLNGADDVFLHDRTSGVTSLVSLDSTGAQANGASARPLVSEDGRYVVFESDATNLDANDTNAARDVFVRDTQLGTTKLVSLLPSGAQAAGPSGDPSLTPDGLFAAFRIQADVYVRDLTTNTTSLVSIDQFGAGPVGGSFGSSISADGRYVAFASLSGDIVAPDTNGAYDVFVRDTQSGVTALASVDTFGNQADAVSGDPAISPDGRHVAYFSNATNLVANDTNGRRDVFLHDLATGETTRVSVDSAGVEGDELSRRPSVSFGGRYVAFYSQATNLVAGDANGVGDIFLRDTLFGTTVRVSVDGLGAEADAVSSLPSLSALGQWIAFSSDATNLVTGDLNTVEDVFVRDQGVELPVTYCTAGTSTNGCVPSISASANPSLTLAAPCMLAVSSLEGQKQGLFYYGIDNTSFTPTPWGATSFRCAKSPIKRTGAQNSGGTAGQCDGAFALDWDLYQATFTGALGNPWTLWERAYVQAWYRDPPATKGSNLTNALVLTYQP
jgi:Tol biopolymer transport system component